MLQCNEGFICVLYGNDLSIGESVQFSPLYYSHARGILCGIHTTCMGSPFPAHHAEWSFRSFVLFLIMIVSVFNAALYILLKLLL